RGRSISNTLSRSSDGAPYVYVYLYLSRYVSTAGFFRLTQARAHALSVGTCRVFGKETQGHRFARFALARRQQSLDAKNGSFFSEQPIGVKASELIEIGHRLDRKSVVEGSSVVGRCG